MRPDSNIGYQTSINQSFITSIQCSVIRNDRSEYQNVNTDNQNIKIRNDTSEHQDTKNQRWYQNADSGRVNNNSGQPSMIGISRLPFKLLTRIIRTPMMPVWSEVTILVYRI